jgi:hypothetical protein
MSAHGWQAFCDIDKCPVFPRERRYFQEHDMKAFSSWSATEFSRAARSSREREPARCSVLSHAGDPTVSRRPSTPLYYSTSITNRALEMDSLSSAPLLLLIGHGRQAASYLAVSLLLCTALKMDGLLHHISDFRSDESPSLSDPLFDSRLTH